MKQNRLWIIAESKGCEIKEPTLEVLTEVSRLAAQRNDGVMVLVCGLEEGGGLDRKLGCYGADTVLPLAGSGDGSPRQVSSIVAALASKYCPEVIFTADTIWGHDVAAWLAAKLKTTVITNCIELGLGPEKQIMVTRHIYGNTVAVKYSSEKGKSMVVTVQPGFFNVKKSFPAKKAKVLDPYQEQNINPDPVRVLEFIKADFRTVDIEDAERLVVGGRGMGTTENFKLIYEAAEVLGAAVGGTRVARDNGWIPLERQIGQTGKTVAPDLLISCGVSGAMQHTMGLKETKYLVAINTDKNAPIFKLADLSIVDDAPKVLKELIARIKAEAERG